VILLLYAFCAQHIKGALLLNKLIFFRMEQLNFEDILLSSINCIWIFTQVFSPPTKVRPTQFSPT